MNIFYGAIASIFFFLPAGVSNTMPILVSKVPGLKNFNQPIDFGLSYKGIRILGDHKTIRGYVFGVLSAILIVYLQQYLYLSSEFIREISIIDYSVVNPVILGFLLGFGALFGDSVKSFFKRRSGVKSGQSWFPFDQIDYIVGGLIFVSFYKILPWQAYLYTFVIWFGMHLLFTYIGYLLKLKKDPI